MPKLVGTGTNDTLIGTAGDDILEGLRGDDYLRGGDGDDVIIDTGGDTRIEAGAGNDRITVNAVLAGNDGFFQEPFNIIDAGDGDDRVDFYGYGVGRLWFELGAGNDTLFLQRALPDDTRIGLGAGQDRLIFDRSLAILVGIRSMPVVRDFTPGADGDILDIADLIDGALWFSPFSAVGANPFSSGHLVLAQAGADLVVRFDLDGFGPGTDSFYVRDIVRLLGVQADALTAENFGGWDPQGAAPVGQTVDGTASPDVLRAGVGGGAVHGLAGDDQLWGSLAIDMVSGGDGNDTIEGDLGDDSLQGGDGNDRLTDQGGNDRLDGGAGNDVIDLVRVNNSSDDDLVEAVTVAGGDGDDILRLEVERIEFSREQQRTTHVAADLGAGNDRLLIVNWSTPATVRLGAGQDRVELGKRYLYKSTGTWERLPDFEPIVLSDFTPGNNGDILDLGLALHLAGWNLVGNPFASGELLLWQQGKDTIVAVDMDGTGGEESFATIFRLSNVDAETLTAFNFAGFDPRGAAPAGITRNGSATADFIAGSAGGDRVNGLDGDDELHGGFGNDTIDGGLGNDRIQGGAGTDALIGSAGDDVLEDYENGDDRLDGGDGNDRLVVRHTLTPSPNDERITLIGGAGADTAELATGTPFTANLGEGNDRIILTGVRGGGTLTLGAGRDTVALDMQLDVPRTAVVITDFATGNNGDRIDWAFLLQHTQGEFPLGFDPRNPSGYFRLERSGADTLLYLTLPYEQGPLLIFRNTSASAFTAYNLGINVNSPIPDTRTGTASAETLAGTAGDDVISGGGGNDIVAGGLGDDILRGGTGADNLAGGDGNDELSGGPQTDTLDGGAGDDLIQDPYGVDILIGGAGHDLIIVEVPAGPDLIPPGSVTAGDGNDEVTLDIESGLTGRYNASLGPGSDRIRIFDLETSVGLSLGAGRDSVLLDGFRPSSGRSLFISDFQPGANGDVIDLRGFVFSWISGRTFFKPPLGPDIDYFRFGYIELRQQGTATELWALAPSNVHRDERIAVFSNTSAGQFTAENFGGMDPQADPAFTRLITGNRTIAAGTVVTMMDPAIIDLPLERQPHFLFYADAGVEARFVNHGTIVTEDSQFDGDLMGLALDQFGSTTKISFHNARDGRFIVNSPTLPASGPEAFTLHTWGIYTTNSRDFRVTNDGYIEVRAAAGIAHAIQIGQSPLLNNGTIRVHGGWEAWGITLDASLAGSIRNTGKLIVHGEEFAVGIELESYGEHVVNNSGTITVTVGPDSPWASIGILVPEQAWRGTTYHHYNSGTINADIAYFVWEYDGRPEGTKDILHNSGTINGAVILEDGDDLVLNSGTMTGRTLLGRGNDRYDGAQGDHKGSVEGGDGADRLTGGSGAEDLFGDGGADTIVGGGGDDYVDGGSGDDLLDGGAGHDVLSYFDSLQPVVIDIAAGTGRTQLGLDYFANFEQVVGSRGNDQIFGTILADTLLGFNGDDLLQGRAGDDRLLGGVGRDLLTGGAGNDRFLFESGDGADQISDFGTGDRIELFGYAGVESVTQVGADVRIKLTATDNILVWNSSVAKVAGALFLATEPLGLQVEGLDRQALRPDSDLIIGPGIDFALTDTDPLRTFRQPPTSTAILLDPATRLWNWGSVTLTTTTNDEFDTIGIARPDRVFSTTETVVNRGTGLISVAAAAGDAIGINSVPYIWNAGTIRVVSESGDATAISGAFAEEPLFVNSGSIFVTAAAGAHGYRSGNGAHHHVNSGKIIVDGGLTSIGVDFIAHHHSDVASTFVNSGTLRVTDDTPVLDSVALRIAQANDMLVWNSGTIAADFAIKVRAGVSAFYGGFAFKLYNSGSITGDIYLSGYDDIIVNAKTITGSLFLGGGNDIYDGRRGTLVGSVDGFDGDDRLLAGAGSQTLRGGFGNDILSGGADKDVLTGGPGRDSFRFGTGFGHDVITDFTRGTAHDYIDVSGFSRFQSITQKGSDVLITFSATDSLLIKSATVAGITSAMIRFGAAPIASLVIPAAPGATPAPAEPVYTPAPIAPIVGTEGADTLTGTLRPEELRGLGGDDQLNGAGGADTMTGGSGNDLYFVDNIGDQVVETSAGGGTDTVTSSIGYTLGAHLEHLILSGTAAIAGTGNALANTLTGNGAANRLDGAAGADVMKGGAGNDIYVVETGADQAVETSAAHGVDLVQSAISLTLGAHLENLVLTGAGATAGTGNTLANVLTGNAAANKLYGLAGDDRLDGGAGADTLTGGDGNDLYVVDQAGDTIAETSAAGGTDSVRSAVSWILGANLENLVLTGGGAIDGTGNALVNQLTGNAAANLLNGGGGADTMTGGAGDDLYVVDNTGDKAVESAGGGIDGVTSRISFALGAHIENLVLSGIAAIDGTGNALDNAITGNGAANIIDGGDGADRLQGGGSNDAVKGGAGNDRLYGGTGHDELTGGSGADGFYFNTALSRSTNVDRILDFSVPADTIFLNRGTFSALAANGALAPGAFRAGSAAADADDRILYETATGRIFYDADGNGAGAAILFAQVSAGTPLTAADFVGYI